MISPPITVTLLRGALLSLLLSPCSIAMPVPPGGGEEDVLVVVDPVQHDALTAANHYRQARDIPMGHFLMQTPVSTTYDTTAEVQIAAFLGELLQRKIDQQIDFVVLAPGSVYRISAAGLINDSCATVNNFSIATPYILARDRERILLGNLPFSRSNGYARPNWAAPGFDSVTSWFGGQSSGNQNARRYFIAGLLGYTGTNGNDLAEVLDMIYRSSGSDSTHPPGTVFYMETTDTARSSPRDGFYPTAVAHMTSAGGQAQHLQAVLPLGNFDCMGVMTGIASADIGGGGFSMLPGSFGDHLTSFAGHFDTSSQSKMSLWISAGASGTAGTVEEPCNYPGKFPHARIHVVYRKGLTLGESWFRSVAYEPFQNLFLGDPLTRAYEETPGVDVPGFVPGLVSGTLNLAPTAVSFDPTDGIAVLELHVDGVIVDSGPAGTTFQLDTTQLSEGWHELRVVAETNHNQRARGRWKSEIMVDNSPDGMLTLVPNPVGDLDTLFEVQWGAWSSSVPDRVVLRHLGRVVAADPAGTGSLRVHGHMLGAGPAQVQVELHFPNGVVLRDTPVVLQITDQSSGSGQAAPTAVSYSRTITSNAAFLLELPGDMDQNPSNATWELLTEPAQATRLSNTPTAWQVFQPNPTASGSDGLSFQVTNSNGTSNVATIELLYDFPVSCATEVYCIGAPNSTGVGASIGHTGSISLATNNLVLEVQDAPINQFALFFQGQGRAQTALGHGWLCMASSFARYGVIQTDSTGSASHALDLTQPPLPGVQIQPGSTWGFQLWYRDPAMGPPGSNLSDALEITFCP
ncbi:MAG TPA: hypothetical protein EYQ25_02700 [Planctomycetes bacterium]|nr:hypothetical protein [Planctomycetota bacterium]HIL36321.1 hypothetical protein [Planctomycetota bacterium]